MWAVGWALAQEPPPLPVEAPKALPAATPPDERSPYELVVYGEMQVARARAAVEQRLEELGYDDQVVDLGDRVVYRHSSPWKGEVVLYDDGWMRVKRQGLRVEGRQMPWAPRNSPGAWAGCLVWPLLCMRSSGAMYGERKWRNHETRTVAGVAAASQTWADRVADLATSKKVDSLPDRLEALWHDGVPLSPQRDGTETLATYSDRRNALFIYWQSRTDTVWGQAVRDAVEGFCRAVVQTSDHPYTSDELASFAAQGSRFLVRQAREPESP